jgi:hypothetical protein
MVKNVVNKINKEGWRSKNGTSTRPSNNGQDPRGTPYKNRTGHTGEHGQDNYLMIHGRK